MTKCGLFRWLIPVVALAALGCQQKYSDDVERSALQPSADPALAATRQAPADRPGPAPAAPADRGSADAAA